MIRGLGPLNSTSIIYSMSIFPSLFSFLSTVFCRTKTGEVEVDGYLKLVQ